MKIDFSSLLFEWAVFTALGLTGLIITFAVGSFFGHPIENVIVYLLTYFPVYLYVMVDAFFRNSE